MKYWDNDFDRQFDEALDNMTEEEFEAITKVAISCKEKLIGAQ